MQCQHLLAFAPGGHPRSSRLPENSSAEAFSIKASDNSFRVAGSRWPVSTFESQEAYDKEPAEKTAAKVGPTRIP